MAEIYRDDVTKEVTLAITGGTVQSVKFVRQGVETTGVFTGNTVLIPYSITYRDGDFDVVWTYTVGPVVYTRTERNTIVTPYFTATDLTTFDSDMSTLLPAQVTKLERLVRGIITAFTGQSFGLEQAALVCYGNGDSILMTDRRVVSITSVAEIANPAVLFSNAFRPVNGGFALEAIEPAFSDNTKMLILSEQIYGDGWWAGFKNNLPYLVTGTFGWDFVPDGVNLAALYLAEEFSCDETMWRDRYLKSIKGEGFDIEFRSDAFIGTGSVTADQLLSKYVANKLAII